MKTLSVMVVRLFIPVLFLSLLFFCTILELADIFNSLVRYLNSEVPLLEIVHIQLLYLPKTVSYSLPIALLFAISYTLGNLYSNNELISVFGSGVSLLRLIRPFLLFGLLFSVAGFYFEERVVIDTFKEKNELSRLLLKQKANFSNPDVTVMAADSRVIYHADFYNDSTRSLKGLLVLERDETGKFLRRMDVESATWTGSAWELSDGRYFYWDDSGDGKTDVMTERRIEKEVFPELNSQPETFRSTTRNVEEMKMEEAKAWIQSLRKAGLPARAALTEYYKRFAFALTPLIVAFISTSIGGRFKKNILLMSLLLSLVISVVYYVTQMVSVIFAKLDYIPPLSGAWSATVLFVIVGMFLFKIART